MSKGLDPTLVDTAKGVLRTGEGNGAMALLVLMADHQERTHTHGFRTPTAAARRRLGLSQHVKTYCSSCGAKRGHDGDVWWG
jgi:hypothetical protein